MTTLSFNAPNAGSRAVLNYPQPNFYPQTTAALAARRTAPMPATPTTAATGTPAASEKDRNLYTAAATDYLYDHFRPDQKKEFMPQAPTGGEASMRLTRHASGTAPTLRPQAELDAQAKVIAGRQADYDQDVAITGVQTPQARAILAKKHGIDSPPPLPPRDYTQPRPEQTFEAHTDNTEGRTRENFKRQFQNALKAGKGDEFAARFMPQANGEEGGFQARYDRGGAGAPVAPPMPQDKAALLASQIALNKAKEDALRNAPPKGPGFLQTAGKVISAGVTAAGKFGQALLTQGGKDKAAQAKGQITPAELFKQVATIMRGKQDPETKAAMIHELYMHAGPLKAEEPKAEPDKPVDDGKHLPAAWGAHPINQPVTPPATKGNYLHTATGANGEKVGSYDGKTWEPIK